MLGIVAIQAAFAAPTGYIIYRDSFLTVDIPVGSKQENADSFALLHDHVLTRFTLAASTPHTDERNVECGGRPASYRISKANLFAYSCEVDGRIRYHVERYGRTYRIGASDGTELIEFTISYPVSQRIFWDPVVAHISGSLRFSR